MNYLSVMDTAKKWKLSDRTVRNYCAQSRIPGAFLTGKTWNIPDDAERPERSNKRSDTPETLLEILHRGDEHRGGLPRGAVLATVLGPRIAPAEGQEIVAGFGALGRVRAVFR